MSGTTLCPRCGAPIPWDGHSKTVNCPFCRVVVTPTPFGQAPVAMRPVAAKGSNAGCIVAAIVGVVVVVAIGGAITGFVLLAKGSATVSPVTVASVTTIAATVEPVPAAAGSPLRIFGEEGNGPGQLTDARSIAVDMDENVYVSDYSDGRVQKLDPNGKFQWIIQVPKNAFSGDDNIFGMAVDTKNVLWVARNGDLLKYATADGKAIGAIKGNYDTMWFKWIAIDPLGNMATTHNTGPDSDLLLLDPSGKVKKRVKNKDPAGLAIDGAGNVYWSDRFENAIEIIDPSGNMKARFGSKKDKHTSGVEALAVDGKGHLFASTSEGVNVFDQGGAYLKTFETRALKGAVRSITVSAKNHLFMLGGEKVAVFEITGI
jgi:streptogramin lyase